VRKMAAAFFEIYLVKILLSRVTEGCVTHIVTVMCRIVMVQTEAVHSYS
jgi:hypothetical protein